ncbi:MULTISPECIES: hypothetical protein [Streptomyces]|uniref:hypothetical protein n=1 Tax=Streptomyces TaxID=1883 RepID=UPI00163C9130|nr:MULTISPECIES: hypothetical protein [Streptomyces]MBC2875738.1 hypothetical protein [Streptomyces sp. TYQ1024]UBI37591.1 hypothetical protein K7I03_14695 [Streptomyces mobaraensis]UKW30179.1 hypothetical protein MCU78_14660 [Streptomyces sp. TYQ1024]
MSGYSVLGVIDRGYRGSVEVQFFDAMYGFLDFLPQLDRVMIALRGAAVTLAVDEDTYRPVVDFGPVRVDTLPDYRAAVRQLIAEKVAVVADEPDLRALGFGPQDLVPGVRCLDTNELTASWAEFDGVWFV